MNKYHQLLDDFVNNTEIEMDLDDLGFNLHKLEEEEKQVQEGEITPEMVMKYMGSDATVYDYARDLSRYLNREFSIPVGRGDVLSYCD